MLFYFNSCSYFPAIVKCNFIIYLNLNLVFKSSFVEDEEQETFIHHKLDQWFWHIYLWTHPKRKRRPIAVTGQVLAKCESACLCVCAYLSKHTFLSGLCSRQCYCRQNYIVNGRHFIGTWRGLTWFSSFNLESLLFFRLIRNPLSCNFNVSWVFVPHSTLDCTCVFFSA